jgi:asparagine synthase (glutamine-hydrolysing)
LELRAALKKDGYNFRTDTDTEVLIALFDRYKEGCLKHLDGMFSFAVWDSVTRQLFCARDRFGEKPFYYYHDQNKFVFASEIKQFWEAGIEKVVKHSRFTHYISTGAIEWDDDIEQTYYENILSLAPSHFMFVTDAGGIVKERYFEIDLGKNRFSGSLLDAIETFRDLFQRSIIRRLRSDVPTGSSLSGGLDSSCIVKSINAITLSNRTPQHTFSARFANFNKDEGPYIKLVVESCKDILQHETFLDKEYFIEHFRKVCYYQDEPFGSSSIVAQYAVMELAKRNGVTVLLDGQGADEYLGGYLRYYGAYLDQLFFSNPGLFENESLNFLDKHREVTTYTAYPKRETYRMKLGRLKRAMLAQCPPIDSLHLKRILKQDVSNKELLVLLRYSDRNSMANSREVRTPFLNHELVEFVFSLPEHFILHEGWTKYILRKSFSELLPKSVVWRKEKIGYEPPQASWLNSPEMKAEIVMAYKAFDLPFDKTGEGDWRVLVASRFL